MADGTYSEGLIVTENAWELKGLVESFVTRSAAQHRDHSAPSLASAALLHQQGKGKDAAQVLLSVSALRERESRQRNLPDTARYAALEELLRHELGNNWQPLARTQSYRTLEQVIALARTALQNVLD